MDYFITLTLVALLFIYLIPTRQEREERRRERDASRDLDDLNQENESKGAAAGLPGQRAGQEPTGQKI